MLCFSFIRDKLFQWWSRANIFVGGTYTKTSLSKQLTSCMLCCIHIMTFGQYFLQNEIKMPKMIAWPAKKNNQNNKSKTEINKVTIKINWWLVGNAKVPTTINFPFHRSFFYNVLLLYYAFDSKEVQAWICNNWQFR